MSLIINSFLYSSIWSPPPTRHAGDDPQVTPTTSTHLLNEPRRRRPPGSQRRRWSPWRVAWTRQVCTWTGVRCNFRNSAPAACCLQRKHSRGLGTNQSDGTISWRCESAQRTLEELAHSCSLSVHGDHRCVRSFSTLEGLLSEGQPHALSCDLYEIKR